MSSPATARVHDVLAGLRRGLTTTTTIAAVVAAECVLAFVVASNRPLVGLAVGALCALVIVTLRLESSLAIIAFPAVFFTKRLAVGGTDLSYADAGLVISCLFAARFVPLHSAVLRRMFTVTLAYMAVLFVAIMFNPTKTAVIEGGHRLVMIGGSIAVGAAIASRNGARMALRLYVGVLVLAGLDAIRWALTRGFTPAFPLSTHKNHAGAMLASGVVMLVVLRKEIGFPSAVRFGAQAVMIVGILACQSRGAAASLMLMMFVNLLRQGIRSSLLVVVGMVALGMMIWTTSETTRADPTASTQGNTVAPRIEAYKQTLDKWQEEPIGGVGIRFWLEDYSQEEPHNLVVSALGETGLIGLGGLILLTGWSMRVMWRTRGPFAWCGFLLILGHVADAALGIFWVAGTGTLLWLVVGLACGDRRAIDDEVFDGAGARASSSGPGPSRAIPSTLGGVPSMTLIDP